MALHVFQLTILPRNLRSDALRGQVPPVSARTDEKTQEWHYTRGLLWRSQEIARIPGSLQLQEAIELLGSLSADWQVPEFSEVDIWDTLDICGAAIIPRNHPSVQFMVWGQGSISAVLSPLLSSPEVRLLVDRLEFVELGLTEQIEVIDNRTQTFSWSKSRKQRNKLI